MIKYKNLIDLLFPPCCVVCASPIVHLNSVICNSCISRVRLISGTTCSCCGMALPDQNNLVSYVCGLCLKNKPAFDTAKSIFWYEEVVKDLLTNVKFNNDTPSLAGLEMLFKKVDLSFFNDCDLIIPVPLHPKRLRQRGFNQSMLLCRLLFPDRLKDIEPFLLLRRAKTKPQTGLSGVERRKNLKNVFSLSKPGGMKNKKVCLVDDVYTTGTTVDECSRTLKVGGCKSVKVLTVARVLTG